MQVSICDKLIGVIYFIIRGSNMATKQEAPSITTYIMQIMVNTKHLL